MENIIKVVRKTFNLTQVQLSKEMCVSLDTIKSWETGRNPVPPLAKKYIFIRFGITFNPRPKVDNQPDLF
jgi:DNA-binding transcriptional regulator YiaG